MVFGEEIIWGISYFGEDCVECFSWLEGDRGWKVLLVERSDVMDWRI